MLHYSTGVGGHGGLVDLQVLTHPHHSHARMGACLSAVPRCWEAGLRGIRGICQGMQGFEPMACSLGVDEPRRAE